MLDFLEASEQVHCKDPIVIKIFKHLSRSRSGASSRNLPLTSDVTALCVQGSLSVITLTVICFMLLCPFQALSIGHRAIKEEENFVPVNSLNWTVSYLCIPTYTGTYLV